jgi:cell division protein FtsB
MKMAESAPLPPSAAPSARARRRPRSNTETRQQRRRVVIYVLLAGAAVLMVNALVGENGYLASLRAEREYSAAMAQYVKLRSENQQLREQARRLRNDPVAIEDAARRDLGLIRPGETLVIVHDARPKQGK